MYNKILIALDDSPEARRALHTSIKMAQVWNAELYAITVQENMPGYMAYVAAVAPEATRVLEEERRIYYTNLQEEAKKIADAEGVVLHTRLTEDSEVAGITAAVSSIGADILVIGLHRRAEGLTGFLASTAHKLAQTAGCDVLGVH